MHDHAHEGHEHAATGEGAKRGCMHRGGWHWACCIMPVLTAIFWVASIVFVAAAWVSVVRQSYVWGFPPDWWLVNALMFGVLSLFGRGKGRGHGCMCACCSPGMYKVEK